MIPLRQRGKLLLCIEEFIQTWADQQCQQSYLNTEKEQFEIVPEKYTATLLSLFSLSKSVQSLIPLMTFFTVWDTFQCSVSLFFFFPS